MKPRPTSYQKFFWSDFFADTYDLDGVASGAYLHLIGYYWLKGQPLPDEDLLLARVTKLTAKQWASVRPALERFFVIASGEWRHGRIDHDLSEAYEAHSRAVENGRKGGKVSKPQATLEPPLSQAQATLKQPEPEPEPIKKEPPKPPEGVVDGFEEFWSAYSRHDGRRLAEKAFAAALKKVDGDPSVLIRAAKRYSRQFVTGAKDKQYQAMPATWLNQERWNDQSIAPAPRPEPERQMTRDEYLASEGAKIEANPTMMIPAWFKRDSDVGEPVGSIGGAQHTAEEPAGGWEVSEGDLSEMWGRPDEGDQPIGHD